MVAITVIVAAVVAAFTMGMTTNIPKPHVITAAVTHADAKSVVVTYNGGEDQTSCVGIRWDISTSSGLLITSFQMGSDVASAPILTVGSAKTFSTNYSGKKHIVATAYFTDNTQQVILDTFEG